MVHWTYECVVEATVTRFCRRAVPDVAQTDDISYRIERIEDTGAARRFYISVDLQTVDPENSVWLDFVINKPFDGTDYAICDIHAVRSEPGSDGETTLAWTDAQGAWMPVD